MSFLSLQFLFEASEMDRSECLIPWHWIRLRKLTRLKGILHCSVTVLGQGYGFMVGCVQWLFSFGLSNRYRNFSIRHFVLNGVCNVLFAAGIWLGLGICLKAAPTLEEWFPSVSQEVYPLMKHGIREPVSMGELPDGRLFLMTDPGEVFVFDGKNWNLLDKSFPEGTAKSLLDAEGNLWIGGKGFFGQVDDTLDFHNIADLHFKGEIDSTLSILWIFETGDWIHFANNKSVYHYHRFDPSKCYTTRFEGMFDGYLWMWDGVLYVGKKDRVLKWENDQFVYHMDWGHKYRSFMGWEFDGKEYFLNATHLYVYENGSLVNTIKDDLMKLRGANFLQCENYLLLFTHQGIVKMNRNGSCEGFFCPWYHKKITNSNTYEPFYVGGADFWFLTDSAIFQASVDSGVKTIGVESGYPLAGAWDTECFGDEVYFSSIQGLERWNWKEGIFEFPHEDAPDFETTDLWKAFDSLMVSTWVELGSLGADGCYKYHHSDGFYQIYADAGEANCFWVAMDHGVRKMNQSFEILKEVPIPSEITSMVEYGDKLWVTTLGVRLFQLDINGNGEPLEVTDTLENYDLIQNRSLHVFALESGLFVATEMAVYEWDNGQERFSALDIPLESGWKWAIPRYASQYRTVVLAQKHSDLSGWKIGKFSIDTATGTPVWEPSMVPLGIQNASLRRIKALDGFVEEVVAVVTQSSLLLIDLDKYLKCPILPETPMVLKSIDQLGVSEPGVLEGIHTVTKSDPIRVQLRSTGETLANPIQYYGRLRGQTEWVKSETGAFEFYGVFRGNRVFEGFAEGPFGIRSEMVEHRIRVIAPWYLNNLALLVYFVVLILIIMLTVKLQTHRLSKRAETLEKVVKDRTRDLLQANEAKSIFVSNVSHEIRNPLNGLLGLAQTLKIGDRIDERTLQRLRRPSLYLYRFLTNVLDFSKFETGGVRLVRRVFDTNELLESVETMFSGEFRERSLTFIAEYRTDTSPFIISSQEAVEMVLVNLVGNAVKFTPENGNIRIAILIQEQILKCSVSDTGIGISAAELERVFDPYEQGSHSSLVAGEKGAGIGLSLVQHTVEQLGGEISVRSVEGEGSTFTFSVPIETPTEAKYRESIDQVSLQGKYLIVEDLEYNLKLFSDLLKSWGAEVVEALNGEVALSHALNEPFDMIFLDYDLPDTNGVEISRKLRADSANRKTAIVGLSAYTDQAFIQEGLNSGMNDYLFKPLNSGKLVETIKQLRPDIISYTTLTQEEVASQRSSLRKIKRSTQQVESTSSIDEYLSTFEKLVVDLKLSDLGSPEFETLVHQLKGHCAFINHGASVEYFQRLMELSACGQRMGLLDEMEKLNSIAQLLKREVYGLRELEKDFEIL